MINCEQPYYIIKDEKRFTVEERRDSSGNPFLFCPVLRQALDDKTKKIVTNSPEKSSDKIDDERPNNFLIKRLPPVFQIAFCAAGNNVPALS